MTMVLTAMNRKAAEVVSAFRHLGVARNLVIIALVVVEFGAGYALAMTVAPQQETVQGTVLVAFAVGIVAVRFGDPLLKRAVKRSRLGDWLWVGDGE